jgi:hypothetical protein
MPYTVRAFQPTPNPNALKCVLDRRIADRPRSYFRPEQASADPVAAGLFAIAGVTNVLISGDWVTVNKSSEAQWPAIKSAVERVLRDAQ